jgi:hypothetical protein
MLPWCKVVFFYHNGIITFCIPALHVIMLTCKMVGRPKSKYVFHFNIILDLGIPKSMMIEMYVNIYYLAIHLQPKLSVMRFVIYFAFLFDPTISIYRMILKQLNKMKANEQFALQLIVTMNWIGFVNNYGRITILFCNLEHVKRTSR